ncbi:MAG TPA: ATP-binding protein [Acidobacteriaceae bacterium]|jgi:signal transduction histidine kinase|nr:ATP-binding protein [Acidobacteriaceae bacterium]
MDTIKDEATSRVIEEQELSQLIRKVPVLAKLREQDLSCLGRVEMVQAPAGTVLYRQGQTAPAFCMLLDGEVRATRYEANGNETPLQVFRDGETFGESPLLLGAEKIGVQCETATATRLLKVDAEGFWRLMATCPTVRQGVLANAAQRIHAFQANTLHQEKLISLGTLAAGLMHELNNPGSAAKRSAAQLRENLTRLQDISLRFCRTPMTAEQANCLLDMKSEVLALAKAKPVSSIEEADAEEELANWLESIGVTNAWKLAPTLVAAGWRRSDIESAQEAFPAEMLQDALNWLEALISATQQLSTIEESLSRVTELVIAVKKYAYEDKSGEHIVDVHESIQSTLTILGHKFRNKQLVIEKDFVADLPKLKTRGTGLSQVWTNLLDNATDAAPDGSKVRVRTWFEKSGTESGLVCVGIADEGAGIAPEVRDQIFEPFFTTKPVGVGTGLGLEIARRIVTAQFNGAISFTSEPGHTEFVVKLPVGQA